MRRIALRLYGASIHLIVLLLQARTPPPRRFIRVHSSAIINLAFVQEIQKQISSYDVILQNGDVVRVSRGYMENIKRLTY